MNYNITLNKGRLQAVNMPKKPALCFKRKDKCEFEDTDWGECLCEKYYREYDQNLAKAKSEAIDFRPEDKKYIYASLANRGLTSDQLQNTDIAWDSSLIDVETFERTFIKEGETYPVPDGFEIEICVDQKQEEYKYKSIKYARLVPIKEQKQPFELAIEKAHEREDIANILEKHYGKGNAINNCIHEIQKYFRK